MCQQFMNSFHKQYTFICLWITLHSDFVLHKNRPEVRMLRLHFAFTVAHFFILTSGYIWDQIQSVDSFSILRKNCLMAGKDNDIGDDNRTWNIIVIESQICLMKWICNAPADAVGWCSVLCWFRSAIPSYGFNANLSAHFLGLRNAFGQLTLWQHVALQNIFLDFKPL